MKLSKWKLMALIIPAAWTSISYAYDWNDDVTQRVQTLIENAANKYVQGDYDSYNSDTETAINLLLTVEPQPQSPEQIDARKILAAQLVDETVKKLFLWSNLSRKIKLKLTLNIRKCKV